MHKFHIPQCSIQNRYVHISVLNGALWDMELVHSGICKIGLMFTLQFEFFFCGQPKKISSKLHIQIQPPEYEDMVSWFMYV